MLELMRALFAFYYRWEGAVRDIDDGNRTISIIPRVLLRETRELAIFWLGVLVCARIPAVSFTSVRIAFI